MQQSSQRAHAWKPWLIYLALAVAVLGLTVGILRSRPVDPYEAEVIKLVSQMGYNRRFQEPKVRLGPKAYPVLARMIRGHDTKLDELYDRLRATLPPSVRRVLPERQSKDELHRKAQGLIMELGPVACRALLGAIHDGLAHEKAKSDMELLRTLYWSVPESSKALDALRDWLAKPEPRRMLFGMMDAAEIWPQVPQLAPLLVPWLRLADQARDAAEALGCMGSNAVVAVPDLVDMFNNGVAGRPPNTNLVIGYAPSMDPLTWNRGAAIQALGNIGLASPAVLEAMTRGWCDGHSDIRAQTADAVGMLGPKSVSLLTRLLQTLDTTNRLVLEYQIEAIGKMGPGAREAIPTLRQWADPDLTAKLPQPEPFRRAIRWFNDPLTLPGGAAVALFQIHPESAKGHGKAIAGALQGGFGDVEKLRQLRPLKSEILPALEPSLQADQPWIRQFTALQILCLEPSHARAKAVLLAGMQQADPDLRAQAAYYFWQVTGETNQVLSVIRETLTGVRDVQSQAPLNYAAALGPVAKPLVPQIRPLLEHDERIIRDLAGKALRRIDASALPPVNEGYPSRQDANGDSARHFRP